MLKGSPSRRNLYMVLMCSVAVAGFVYSNIISEKPSSRLTAERPTLSRNRTFRDGSSRPRSLVLGDTKTSPGFVYSNIISEKPSSRPTAKRPTLSPNQTLRDESSRPHSLVLGDTKTPTFQSPPLTTTTAKVIIFILSRRDNFETRQVIRETWGKDHDNVYFVVGRACPLPPRSRQVWTCLPKGSNITKADSADWESRVSVEDARIMEEHRKYGDMLWVVDVDVYRHLPGKLKSAYAWAVTHTQAMWFVKTDDDSVVRVDTLGHYLTTTYNATVPSVIGYIAKGWGVPKHWKNAELTYSKSKYPNFPLGSVGHAVSRPVAEYVAEYKDTLFNYQGEDVSIGIWLDESPLKEKVVWITSRNFSNNGNCKDANYVMIGHNINAVKMKACNQHLDEVKHEVKKEPEQVTWHVDHVDPGALDISNRFDIMVKTVYAIFLRRGKVPIFVKNMYNRHLEVWNQFREPCTFAGGKDWFDSTSPCVKKSTAEDFQRSFSKTLDSIANDGFDTNRSLVPVTSAGFPLNGAHRIAAAIALGLPAMPVQRVASKSKYKWGYAFFSRLGFEGMYADFTMLQWTLHVSNVRTVIFWPEAASNTEKMKQARVMVQQDCGDVLYKKEVKVSRQGVASLALHAYGDQDWLLAKIKMLQTIFSGPDNDMRSIYVLFVRPISTTHLKTCKTKLRSYFALVNSKSSVHIPDYHGEAVLIAEMVLNPNSMMFLNRHEGGSCQEEASNLARRLNLSPVNPESFVLPQDIMVDTGAVSSFFGLRNRTDVDLLYQGKLNKSLLGESRGISVEAHPFQTFRCVATERAPTKDLEHLSRCTVDDFFTDPQYYGYCCGIKFVSLEYLIRFKQWRGVPNKDYKDVESMSRFVAGTASMTSQPYIREAKYPDSNNKNIVWPPVLFVKPNRFDKAAVSTFECLVSVARNTRTSNGSACVAVYLQSGASLGKYRQGGPIAGDSDIDIRVVRNYECNSDTYNILPRRVANCNRPGSQISLNRYDEWGDSVSNLTQQQDGPPYPRIGHSAMKALVSTLTYTTIDSTNRLQFFIRKPDFLLGDLRREYGPAWFVPNVNHGGIRTSQMRLGFKNERVRAYLCKDIDKYENVHVDDVMNKSGVTSDGYAKISLVERCKANKWFAWIARFCRGETKLPAQYNAPYPSGSPAWSFPECEAGIA